MGHFRPAGSGSGMDRLTQLNPDPQPCFLVKKSATILLRRLPSQINRCSLRFFFCWIRNHIEDVKTMMESQHGGHYTLYNLCERTYAASRFPSGHVVHAPLISQDSAPCLDTLLDLCAGILDYLSRDENQRTLSFCLMAHLHGFISFI